MHGLGSSNIDHRLRQRDFRVAQGEPAVPWLGMRFADLESLDSLLMVGCDLRGEAPILAHRVRKAALSGARISYLDLKEREYLHPIENAIVAPPQDWASLLAKRAAGTLRGEHCAVWFGGLALRHPNRSELLEAVANAALSAGAVTGFVTDGGNAAGLALAGALPFGSSVNGAAPAAGKDAEPMSQGSPRGLILVGVEPEFDCTGEAVGRLAEAEFVLALNPWTSPWLLRHAQVILPTAAYLETPGTFVNGQLDWQSFAAAAPPPGQAQPAWKVLRVLAEQLSLKGLSYATADAVLAELRSEAEAGADKAALPSGGLAGVARAGGDDDFSDLEVPSYAADGLVRRSLPLQEAAATRRAA